MYIRSEPDYLRYLMNHSFYSCLRKTRFEKVDCSQLSSTVSGEMVR